MRRTSSEHLAGMPESGAAPDLRNIIFFARQSKSARLGSARGFSLLIGTEQRHGQAIAGSSKANPYPGQFLYIRKFPLSGTQRNRQRPIPSKRITEFDHGNSNRSQ
jgi:hypothetical protein